MNASFDPERELERRIDEALRALPLRAAPGALEARVLAAIAERAALPWWQRRFGEWPRAARLGFVGGCLALVVLAVLMGQAHPATVPVWSSLPVLPGVAQAQALASSLAVLATVVPRALPGGWVAAAFLLSGALYALLFALGTLAYRSLYVPVRWQVTLP